MTTHVFVVDEKSYPVHRDRLFCGVKNPSVRNIRGNYNNAHYNLLSDIFALRLGDLVFFYQMHDQATSGSRGFRGIFRVCGEPYYDKDHIYGIDDPTGKFGSKDYIVYGACPYCQHIVSDKCSKEDNVKVCRCVGCNKKLDWHILPFRVPIEPVEIFRDNKDKEAVISDNVAYISRKYIKNELPVLWTLLFRKVYGAGRERSIAPILPEESDKLQHIFKEEFETFIPNTFEKYVPKNAEPIRANLETSEKGELRIEGMLQAWITKNIDRNNDPVLSAIIGNPNNIEFIGGCVLYGIGGENVDILLTHKENGIRTHATVIELKKGSIVKKDVGQIAGYVKWVAQLVFGNDDDESLKKIQPVLIGFKPKSDLSDLVKNIPVEMKCRPAKVLSYTVDGQNLIFNEELC